ncbi:conserved hypothetical protein [Flavobacterium sp. 9AF]|uniref:hypothetical protein n=1 Tax=Flavobacterium sp. 9AF TaxID=2653142 RepID=UPI0012F2ADF1|nr:hypothetical protein [Flavobacterium sp. 9AF]VXB67523.1 conserved hypothetical protein [Flavobacterium sp. 9AF]
MKAILLFIPALLLISCNEKKQDSTSEPFEENIQISIPSEQETTFEESTDTIVYDNNYYPIDSLLSVKLLAENIFHEDEVEINDIKKDWYGLFIKENVFYLKKTKLITKRVNDPILDENEKDKTAWDISSEIKDTSIILIENIPFLSEGKIKNYALSQYIYPNDTLKFNFLNKDYIIYATGSKRKESENSNGYIVWNYKLYLTTVNNGIEHTDLLVAKGRFDDAMINIIFAGDIDQDGNLDLLIDTSNHYNVTSPTLYLSKPAEEGHCITPIATHTSVGC